MDHPPLTSGVLDGGPRLVWLQITLRNIGPDIVAVDEYMIPRLIFIRLGFSYRLIPFISTLEVRIRINYNSTILEFRVVNNLSKTEFKEYIEMMLRMICNELIMMFE